MHIFVLFFFPSSLYITQILVRRLLILVVYVTQYTQVAKRTYGVAILCLAICAIHFAAWPFKNEQDNVLEAVSLTLLTYAAVTKVADTIPGKEVVCVCVCVCK